ncbi:hypothetical protein J437_LFUL010994 [Ladona fulva]|uniref:PiggyBac transposable element-derived protein domain-containing protein n=1 Tax=Ladona fulva TaxID=123851 RepID=A0A8K0P719_LADFU|nr:hypothetical protein J437_LFUL010994 [Ladona fulva]
MGLVNMQRIAHYWSTKSVYRNDIAQAMSRNRFQLLLQMLHFYNNEEALENDRLHKIQPLLDKIVIKFLKMYNPGKNICIDESLVPFQGRLIMKQYIPQKRHKYGVKLYKLCFDKGYMWNMKNYAGKDRDSGRSAPTAVVMELAERLLDAGRKLITDNYYTSLELAEFLINRVQLLPNLPPSSLSFSSVLLYSSLCSRLAILLPSGSSSTLPPPPPVQGLSAFKPCAPALSPRISALSSQRCCYPEPYHSLDIRLHCLMRGCQPGPYHSPDTH